MILSFGVLKTLWIATVNSTTPSVGARWPPISLITSIIWNLSSFANCCNLLSEKLRISAGDLISGRILIPKDLINHANIKKEVVVSSAVNILEIWDKTYYENAIDDAKFDFGNLAEEVMGDKDD